MRILVSFLVLFLSSNISAESKPTGTELITSKFNLTTHLNEEVSEKDFYGKYMLVFFGFSHCKTICPAGLSTLVATVNELKEVSDPVVPVFITIDPERDTVERLASYVSLFDPKLVGLTGSMEDTKAVAKSFRAYYGRTPTDAEGDYSFDHSSIIYMIGKKGEYLTHFSSTIGAKEIAKQVKEFIK